MTIFKKSCKRCHEIYQPTSKFSRICEKCHKPTGGQNKLTIQKLKCPYLASNKFCTHRQSGASNGHRSVCQYKNCIDCGIFLDWAEELYELNKIPPHNA